jgi:hypothetical protein
MTRLDIGDIEPIKAMTGHPERKESDRAKGPRLDANSRATLYRFAFTVGLFLAWLVPQGSRGGLAVMDTAMLGAAAITALLAAAFHEPFRAPSLNRWDETLAYLGIAALVRTMS